MIYAALHSSTPILVKHQSHLLRFGFVSLKPDFRLEKDGCLERGSPLDYLGAAGRNPSGACCGGSRPLSCGLGGAGFGHFLLDAGECRFVRFVRSFRCRFHVYLELQEEPRLTLPLNTMIEAAKTRVCSIAHRCLCNHDLTRDWYQTDAGNPFGYNGPTASCLPGFGGAAHDVLPDSVAKRNWPQRCGGPQFELTRQSQESLNRFGQTNPA